MSKRSSEERSDKMLSMAENIRAKEDIEYPERYTQEGIAKRREMVWKYMARRVPQTVMAELLGVSRRTIYTDVQWWQEQCQGYIKKLKEDPAAAEADIGLTAMRLEGMAQMAMNEAELAQSGQNKSMFMNNAMRAENSRIDLLVRTGIYPKAGEDVRHHHTVKATFSAKLGDDSPLASLDNPSSRRRVLTAAEQILRLTTKKNGTSDDDMPIVILDDPQPETIDITGQVKVDG
jgi:hypothetical protein